MSAIENNKTTVNSTKTGHELSCYGPTDFEFAEFFGGGSEYVPFWRSPFSLIRLFEKENE
jgi:hypothetical protein